MGLYCCHRCGWSGRVSGAGRAARCDATPVPLTPENKDASREALLIMIESSPADDGHPYLETKGVNCYGLQQLDDNRELEQSIPVGSLILHAENTEGIVTTLQFITPEGDKLFLRRGKKKGSYFTIGDLDGAERIYLAEGYATAATVYEATNRPVVVAFDAGNLQPVAIGLRSIRPDTEIIIAADNDAYSRSNTGLINAYAAARAIGARVAVPAFQDTAAEPTDFNDLYQLEGIDAVRDQLAAACEPPPEPLAPEIEELNQSHAVVDVSGKTLVLNEAIAPGGSQRLFTYSSFEDLRRKYSNRTVTLEGKDITWGNYWLSHEGRRQYDGIGFYPGGESPDGIVNLWSGFAVEPRQGSCELFLAHIRDNIAGGDPEVCAYIIAWLANLMQAPMDRPGTALAMTGKQGTGKGVFASEIGALLGTHYSHVTKAVQIGGRFNTVTQNALLIFGDEMPLAKKVQLMDAFKALITEDTNRIEPKGVNSFSVQNYLRLILATNEHHVIPASLDDRRFLVLQVSDAHQGDIEYFAAIAEEMENGGRAALLHYLLDYDYSEVNLRQVPQTEAMRDQKLMSLSPVTRFIYDRLMEGIQRPSEDEWAAEVRTEDFYTAFCEGRYTSRGQAQIGNSVFGKELVAVLQLPTPAQRRTCYGTRKKHYLFPDLETCREAFEAHVGFPVDWGDSPAEDCDTYSVRKASNVTRLPTRRRRRRSRNAS
tara:strand:+ start:527 stop:2656 length:2130 start_codon:yes stop_codon:yes gene_type:complete